MDEACTYINLSLQQMPTFRVTMNSSSNTLLLHNRPKINFVIGQSHGHSLHIPIYKQPSYYDFFIHVYHSLV